MKQKSLRKEIELRNEFIKEDKLKENAQKLKLAAEELEEKYYEEKKEQEIILKELNNLKESFKKEVLKKEILELKNKELETAIESLNKECTEEKIEKQRILEELEEYIEIKNELSKELINLKEINLIEKEKMERISREIISFGKENRELKIELTKNESLKLRNKELETIAVNLKKKLEEKETIVDEYENTEIFSILQDKIKNLSKGLERVKREKNELKERVADLKKYNNLSFNIFMKRIHLRKINENEIKETKTILDWNEYSLYLKNVEKLEEFVYSFKKKNFKDLYLETKKIYLLNSIEERKLLNIISLLDLGESITNIDFQETLKIYVKYMNIIYKNRLENMSKLDSKEFFIENYTAEDWYKIYEELKKEKKVPKWIRLLIFNLGKSKEEKLKIPKNQYGIIKLFINELSSTLNSLKNLCKKSETILLDKITEEKKENQKIESSLFENILKQGLEMGFVRMEQLQTIDFTKEKDAYDIYEAIDQLECRGIKIKY